MISAMFAEEFNGPALDTSVWLPHYLPAWSSLAETAATYEIRDSCLVLSIPPDQGLWMAAEHPTPLRVSAIQTGNFSGPVGSTIGQQPLDGGSVVREEQETFWGFTPLYGRLEMRARMVISPRSMAAWWMVGLEDRPERCAEICVVEVFGSAVELGRSAEVGMGLKEFRDPNVKRDFAAPRLPIDVAEFHDYAVDWTVERAVFFVDGELIRSCPRPPAYPMQMMIAVFDFPEQSTGADGHLVSQLVVDHVRHTP
jgi:Glycosyl hydrolases family 16